VTARTNKIVMFGSRMNISKYNKLFVLTNNYSSVTIEANNVTIFILDYLQATSGLTTLSAQSTLTTMSETSKV